jgi:hypothetical protein
MHGMACMNQRNCERQDRGDGDIREADTHRVQEFFNTTDCYLGTTEAPQKVNVRYEVGDI